MCGLSSGVDDNEVILDVLPQLERVEVEGNNISWEGGRLVEVKSSFLVLDQSVSVGDIGSVLNSSLKELDQKKNLKSNLSKLQADIEVNQEAINFLLGL